MRIQSGIATPYGFRAAEILGVGQQKRLFEPRGGFGSVRRNCSITLLVAAAFWFASESHAAEFIPMGILPGQEPTGLFWSISEDGSNVVGTVRDLANGGGDTGFHWTRETGIQTLEERYGFLGQARAISADGSTIIGSRLYPASDGSEPFRMTVETGEYSPLSPPAGIDSASVYEISEDGSVVVGVGDFAPPGGSYVQRAIAWNREGEPSMIAPTTITADEILQPEWARAVSFDGDVIVGSGRVEDRNGDYVRAAGFRWTAEQGAQELPLPGSATPLGLSSDGRWTVGFSGDGHIGDLARQALRWNQNSAPLPLNAVTDGWGSAAARTTDDGSIVVGVLYPTNNRSDSLPAIWTEETDFVPLQEMLVNNYGMAEVLDGWRLYRAHDISQDSRFITGTAVDPQGNWQGFVISVPEPNGVVLFGIGALCLATFLRAENRLHLTPCGQNIEPNSK